MTPIKLIQLVVTLEDTPLNRKEIYRLHNEARYLRPDTYKWDSIIVREQTILEIGEQNPRIVKARNKARKDVIEKAEAYIAFNKNVKKDLKKKTKKGKKK